MKTRRTAQGLHDARATEPHSGGINLWARPQITDDTHRPRPMVRVEAGFINQRRGAKR